MARARAHGAPLRPLPGARRADGQRADADAAGWFSPEERITDWENANAEGLARARTTLHEIASGDNFDLATISVALRVIRTLVAYRQEAGSRWC